MPERGTMASADVPRAELESAFAHYVETACRSVIEGDMDPWADLFTEDAEYVERIQGTYRGREAIRTWLKEGLPAFPQSEMVDFPVTWSVMDEHQGAVVFVCFNQLSDPGDGSCHRAEVWARLRYAGNGRWHGEENIYNLDDFTAMAQGWVHAHDGGVEAPTWTAISDQSPPEAPARPTPRAELEAELERYYAVIADCRRNGSWERFGDLFTDDVEYVDHAVGVLRGRDALVEWMVQTMAMPDYGHLERFDILWRIVDPARGWVVLATRNAMDDPGDGSEHAAHDWGRMVYAGNGRWSYKESMYNPHEFAAMFEGWSAARDAASQ